MQFAEVSAIKIINKILSAFAVIYIAVLSVISSLTVIVAMYFQGKKAFFSHARFWAKQILTVGRVRLKIIGSENIDINESYIFCANHSSMIDIPVLLSAVKHDFRIIYKKELQKIPVFGWGLARSPFISIKRENPRDSMAGIDEAVESIRSGESVVIFPEGTRSFDGKIAKFKRGAFLLAARSGKKIVPVTVIGSSKILPNKKFLLNPGEITVIFSEPIEYSGQSKVEEVKLMNEVAEILTDNLEKYNS